MAGVWYNKARNFKNHETKMNLKDLHKKYVIGLILLVVVVLIVITVVDPGTLTFRDNTDYDALRKQAEQGQQAYNALLADVEPNYAASKQFLEKIATEDIVRKEVETALNTKQQVAIPAIANTSLKIASRNDRATVVNYVTDLGSMLVNYNNAVSAPVSQVFDQNANAAAMYKAQADTVALVQNLRTLSVPPDAAELHKASIVTYEEYGQMFNTAAKYADGTTPEPWSDVYGQYKVMDNQLGVVRTEMDRLTQKYALQDVTIEIGSGPLFKTAQAQFAVIDVEAVAREAIKVALARAFGNFFIQMVDKLVGLIEKNFAIASQLYYSNELGRYYSVEYMKKFVDDPLDQEIITKFLPEYFCVPTNRQELKNIFTAKARQNQGTDIVIDPADPNFLVKLARIGGDEKNYPSWWEDYFTTLASKTQRAAESASAKEVTSPGLKSGRDIINGQINKTMSSIFNVQEAAIAGTMNLGTNNTENVVGQIIAGLVQNLVNKFVFTPLGSGQTGPGGGIGILKESNVCIRTPQIKPVTPLPEHE